MGRPERSRPGWRRQRPCCGRVLRRAQQRQRAQQVCGAPHPQAVGAAVAAVQLLAAACWRAAQAPASSWQVPLALGSGRVGQRSVRVHNTAATAGGVVQRARILHMGKGAEGGGGAGEGRGAGEMGGQGGRCMLGGEGRLAAWNVGCREMHMCLNQQGGTAAAAAAATVVSRAPPAACLLTL